MTSFRRTATVCVVSLSVRVDGFRSLRLMGPLEYRRAQVKLCDQFDTPGSHDLL